VCKCVCLGVLASPPRAQIVFLLSLFPSCAGCFAFTLRGDFMSTVPMVLPVNVTVPTTDMRIRCISRCAADPACIYSTLVKLDSQASANCLTLQNPLTGTRGNIVSALVRPTEFAETCFSRWSCECSRAGGRWGGQREGEGGPRKEGGRPWAH
jgi:hypothetical protein